MNEYNWDIEELMDYSRLWGLQDRRSNFFRPHKKVWPITCSINECCNTLFRSLNAQDRHIFLQALAACALLSGKPEREKAIAWLIERVSPAGLGLPFRCWEDLIEMRWLKIPVAVISNRTRRGFIIDVLFGAGPGRPGKLFPEPLEKNIGQETLEAVDIAKSHLPGRAKEGGLFIWPFLDVAKHATITGKSLALPVYLAWMSLLEDCEAPSLSATGSIDFTGSVVKVEGIEEKIRAAERHQLLGLIYPADCTVPSIDHYKLELLPVSDLAKAWALWRCYLPGKGGPMSYLIQESGSTSSKAMVILDLPFEFLNQAERSFRTVSRTLKDILTNNQDVDSFLLRLERLAADPRSDFEALCRILDFCSPELIRDIGASAPENAFKICTVKILLLNHLGKGKEAEELASLAADLIPHISPWEEADRSVFNFYNLKLVSLHNRFCFNPGILEILEPQIKAFLEQSEEELRLRRQRCISAVANGLGAFYGTLAQHYGFCGPDYLATFEANVLKALDAFGSGQVKGQPFIHWLRDVSYRIYAYLDADRAQDAKHFLLTYLQVNDLRQLQPTKDSYKVAALLRFAADTGLTGFLDFARNSLRLLPKNHPYQLCLLNAGRLADADNDFRIGLWRESAKFCLGHEGATVKVMALLPLSRLYCSGGGERDFLERSTKEVLKILSTDQIERSHFKVVLDAGRWDDVLETVETHRNRLFPFTYR